MSSSSSTSEEPTQAPTVETLDTDRNYLLLNLIFLVMIWVVMSCLTWYGLSKLAEFVMNAHPRNKKGLHSTTEKSLSKLQKHNSSIRRRKSQRRIELTYCSDCLYYCEIIPESDSSYRPVYWSYFQLYAMAGLLSSFVAITISLYQSTVEAAVMRTQDENSMIYQLCITAKIMFFVTFGIAYVSFSLFWFERLIVTFEKGSIEYRVPLRSQYAVYSVYGMCLVLGMVAVCVRLSQGGGEIEYRKSKDYNPFRKGKGNNRMTTCEWTTTQGDTELLILTAFYGIVFTCVNLYLAFAYVRRLQAVVKAVSQRRTLARKSSPLPSLRYEIKTGSNVALKMEPVRSVTQEEIPSSLVRTKSQSQPLPPTSVKRLRSRTDSIVVSTSLSREERVVRKTAVIALVSFSSTIVCFVVENAMDGIGFLFQFDILVNCVCMICVFSFANHLYRFLFRWIEELCLPAKDRELKSQRFLHSVTGSVTEIDLSELPDAEELHDEDEDDDEFAEDELVTQPTELGSVEIAVEIDNRDD